jgi:putative transposase
LSALPFRPVTADFFFFSRLPVKFSLCVMPGTRKEGLLGQLTKRLVERSLEAEMSDHLGYEPGSVEGRGSGNNRNGKGKKTIISDSGPVEIEVPRDRDSSFEPMLVKKTPAAAFGF